MATHTPTPRAYEQSSGAIYYADGDVEPVIAGINQDGTSEEQADADGFQIVLAVNCHDGLVAALIAAKQEMWLTARHTWTMADFKNWAVIQQIDAALEAADGKPRTAEAIAKAAA